MKTILSFLFALLFIVPSSLSHGQVRDKIVESTQKEDAEVKFTDLQKEQLDAYFDALYDNDKWLGGVAIMQNGKVLYVNNKGNLAATSKRKADAGTRYRIGSITKMFTAALVYRCIEKGELQLDTPLSEFFPEIKNADKITIKHLLGHQSGIFNITQDPRISFYEAYTKDDIVGYINSYTPTFEPGETSQYSNTNYLLLTFIVEDVFRKSYDALLKKYIYSKSGLMRTTYEKEIELNHNETHSYTYNNKEKKWEEFKPWHISLPRGAGMISSTPKDVAKFLTDLMEGRIMTQESIDQMTTIENGYGFGSFAIPYYNDTFYGHNGGIDAFSTNAAYCPENRIAIALFTNGTNYDTNQIAIALLDAAYGKEVVTPTF